MGWGIGGLSRQNEATLWLGTAGLRLGGGGEGEFSHAPPSLRSDTIENYCLRITQSFKDVMCATRVYLTNYN